MIGRNCEPQGKRNEDQEPEEHFNIFKKCDAALI